MALSEGYLRVVQGDVKETKLNIQGSLDRRVKQMIEAYVTIAPGKDLTAFCNQYLCKLCIP